MGAPEGEGGGGGDESSSIALMLRHPSARQCYFEMKINKEPYFSILSSIILWALIINVVVQNQADLI